MYGKSISFFHLADVARGLLCAAAVVLPDAPELVVGDRVYGGEQVHLGVGRHRRPLQLGDEDAQGADAGVEVDRRLLDALDL